MLCSISACAFWFDIVMNVCVDESHKYYKFIHLSMTLTLTMVRICSDDIYSCYISGICSSSFYREAFGMNPKVVSLRVDRLGRLIVFTNWTKLSASVCSSSSINNNLITNNGIQRFAKHHHLYEYFILDIGFSFNIVNIIFFILLVISIAMFRVLKFKDIHRFVCQCIVQSNNIFWNSICLNSFWQSDSERAFDSMVGTNVRNNNHNCGHIR